VHVFASSPLLFLCVAVRRLLPFAISALYTRNMRVQVVFIVFSELLLLGVAAWSRPFLRSVLNKAQTVFLCAAVFATLVQLSDTVENPYLERNAAKGGDYTDLKDVVASVAFFLPFILLPLWFKMEITGEQRAPAHNKNELVHTSYRDSIHSSVTVKRAQVHLSASEPPVGLSVVVGSPNVTNAKCEAVESTAIDIEIGVREQSPLLVTATVAGDEKALPVPTSI
jgi:hypothetical protein